MLTEMLSGATVYVVTGYTDMRKGIDGLAQIVEGSVGKDCGIHLLLRRVSDTVTDCLPLNANMTARTRKESRYGNRFLPKKNTAVVMRKRNPFWMISSNGS